MYKRTHIASFCLALSYVPLALTALAGSKAYAHGATPPSLQGVAIPATPGLLDGPAPIVVNKNAAIQLGKALFWDIQVGSDGMACASCHFHAGADGRFRNQLSPGRLNREAPTRNTFEPTASGGAGGPNYTLKASDFPLYQLADPKDISSAVLFRTDDIVSSSGSFRARFRDGNGARHNDRCTPINDELFHIQNLNIRRTENRQAPSVINASFNFRNFWDGRANNIFNGVSSLGARDKDARILVLNRDGSVIPRPMRLENASLASLSVEPIVNPLEMSCRNRRIPDIGRKLIPRRPLAFQEVHHEDSVLAELRDSQTGRGLDTRYEDLIKQAFARRFWAASGQFPLPGDSGGPTYTQMEANFSLFFGLALQLYQDTLVSDQSPFDSRRLPGPEPRMPARLTAQQRRGLVLFLDNHCFICHGGPTLSSAAHPMVRFPYLATSSLRLVNRRTLNGALVGAGVLFSMMDEGFFNTSVAPYENDPGVGGNDRFGNPLSFSGQYLEQLLTGKPMVDPVAVNSCDMDNPFTEDFDPEELTADPYIFGTCGARADSAKIPKPWVLTAEMQKLMQGRMIAAVNGAFKTPTLRNIELTGPYMHNGSLLTLEQVVDFYFRGGNFSNPHHFGTLVFPETITESGKADLVAFMKSLTDERVRWERAPFDHPQLTIPHGHVAEPSRRLPKQARDLFLHVPAVGRNGRDASLGPIKPFHELLPP